MLEKEDIRSLLKELPSSPGVYRFYSIEKELIYVGKAKSLRKRVANYFTNKKNLDQKTRSMVRKIYHAEYTLVNSEYEALLLENNLIKENKPKYNVLLRDDKTYPFICLSSADFPTLTTTRKIDKKKGEYFGPYTSGRAMHSLVESLRKTFFIRTCDLNLTKQNIDAHKFKVCLEYHIGNCKGPCEGKQEKEDYDVSIIQVRNILKGNFSSVKKYYQEKMLSAAEDMQFEKAQFFKERYNSVLGLEKSSLIVNPDINNLEVYTIVKRLNRASVNFMSILHGSIIKARTIEMKAVLDETEEELLMHALFEIHEEGWDSTKEIICNIELPILSTYCKVSIPQRGDKKKLIDLSLKNAWHTLTRYDDQKKEKPEIRVLKTLQADLSLKELPAHIECFDNSNIQGTNPVAAMVCYKNGKPSKKDYRHFNIKTVEGPNDFASMYEIVYRRYKRMGEEGLPFPTLIIIDGGKGQLSFACQALKDLNIYGQIPIVSIAKNLEELFFPGDNDPLYLDKKSESLKLIQQIRDETHRFAITFHRQKRSKDALLKTEFENLVGIGPGTVKKLLTHFKTVKRIKEASIEQLTPVIGNSKATILFQQLNK
ncbi:excinuclease ABC subunit UvrC [Cytophaga hutchinsonii]|uniref:UvrABC system protein C n=1 Tax=Cytophaga hutchinsonii (strain ATCC 33406 / DSM 1761 / CIP 103989 / NBRC 15051 / NCIMB 9469 / D465) TaxID=269798 RepID=UVRC_CYTH3|nr:excinuclease ABC subunit UvrC [Cytophaga hutchinsonii]Q11YP9.1 RecName: Full=UvrABC system protein C; Short=Protein UvrC; AltName: Full=Excinuclease ABC subunit C [Cytophaga hutchinsonii ATCC 33406]ABG57467.1 excinuclease ABC, subunit C [Cytophaga hutchinsonii ATCC 33406]SFW98148.1 Excinuclease ABC subunit C [Cytophaga hutchinsonii ATCC 33406]